MQDLIRAGAWNGLAEMIRDLGGDPAEIFAMTGLPENFQSDPNAYIPVSLLVQTLELAASQLNQPDLGLRTGRNLYVVLGTISLAVMNAATVREAVLTAARYIHIHNRAVAIDIVPLPDDGLELVKITVFNPSLGKSVQFTERLLAGLYHRLVAILGERWVPVEIRFPNKRLSTAETYKSAFGVVPVFESDDFGLVLTTKELNQSLTGRDENTLRWAEEHLETMGGAKPHTITEKVDLLIRGFLISNDCNMQQIADILGMHRRTLQRRLKEEGSSFEELKDTAKRDRADMLLARDDISLTDVAFMLGYSESSTFSRKARGWFGMSPSAYRKKLLKDAKAR